MSNFVSVFIAMLTVSLLVLAATALAQALLVCVVRGTAYLNGSAVSDETKVASPDR